MGDGSTGPSRFFSWYVHFVKRKRVASLPPRADYSWVLIPVAVFLAYHPALHGGPLWDDLGHITGPQLRSLRGLWRIWSEVGATQQYYPLLHSAFWLEHRLWGDAFFGYHLANVAFHSASAVLLVLILRALAVPGALLAGLIFALHPIAVESVAWISEQKNTLSAAFYLASAYVYLRFAEAGLKPCATPVAEGLKPCATAVAGLKPCATPAQSSSASVVQPFRAAGYWIATALFLCALLSKTVTATLPAALLVVEWWRRGRLRWHQDVRPLLPWFAVAVAAGLFTAWFERDIIGARGADFDLTLIERGLLAGRVIWFYLGKLIWPADLMFWYPRWTIDASVWWQYLFPAAVAGMTIALAIVARRTRGPLAGFLFFCGTLFPVLGFFNVYPFRFSVRRRPFSISREPGDHRPDRQWTGRDDGCACTPSRRAGRVRAARRCIGHPDLAPERDVFRCRDAVSRINRPQHPRVDRISESRNLAGAPGHPSL